MHALSQHGRPARIAYASPVGTERTDEDLMAAWAAGELPAFESLYARHRGMLFRWLLRNVQQQPLAEELFQETWARVVAARERWRPEARFTTWLLQIAHNLMVDHWRRQRPADPDPETTLAALEAPDEQRPDAELSEFEQRRRLQRALEDLPAEQREAFLLRAEAGLGVEEIAQATGVGRETAKSRLRYALARLREALRP
jgi:RNA polymerase sigma-70 factor (ECF subfamily)